MDHPAVRSKRRREASCSLFLARSTSGKAHQRTRAIQRPPRLRSATIVADRCRRSIDTGAGRPVRRNRSDRKSRRRMRSQAKRRQDRSQKPRFPHQGRSLFQRRRGSLGQRRPQGTGSSGEPHRQIDARSVARRGGGGIADALARAKALSSTWKLGFSTQCGTHFMISGVVRYFETLSIGEPSAATSTSIPRPGPVGADPKPRALRG